jgi:replicative DNA helicase
VPDGSKVPINVDDKPVAGWWLVAGHWRSNMRRLGNDILQIAKRMANPTQGVLTGFRDLDSMTLGMQKQDMIIIAGRPSMGKTSYILQIALQMTQPLMIISAEMSYQAVGERLIAQSSGVGMHRLKSKYANSGEKAKANEALKVIADKEIWVSDLTHVTPDGIRSEINRAETKPACVFVDYLQLLSADGFSGNTERETTIISRELKSIAREFDVPMVVASQLNRENEKREGHEPKLSDLRGSGSIEQDADVVLLLHRPSYYRIVDEDVDSQDDGECYGIMCKNRNGPVGRLKYQWEKKCMRFSEQSSKYKEFGE